MALFLRLSVICEISKMRNNLAKFLEKIELSLTVLLESLFPKIYHNRLCVVTFTYYEKSNIQMIKSTSENPE